MWGPHAQAFAEGIEAEIRLTLEEILGCGLGDTAWLQCGLPVKLGGLGVPHPSLVHVVAFLSSSLYDAAGFFSPDCEEAPADSTLWESLARFQGLIGTSSGIWTQWSQDRAVPSAVALECGGWLQQKTWMDLVHSTVSKGLLDCVGRRDQLRLLREREPHAGAWLTCVPNASFGLTFGAAEFRLLLRQHLGLPLLDQSAVGSACPECGEALDLYGDHLVSCRHAGAWLRHNTWRCVVGRIATTAGFTVRNEEPVESGDRPGDLLVEGWESDQDGAVDLTCVHALNLSANWASDVSAVDLAEQAKDTHYAAQCAQAGLSWTPAGIDTFGACGKRGFVFFTKLFDRYAKRRGGPGCWRNKGNLSGSAGSGCLSPTIGPSATSCTGGCDMSWTAR